MSRSQHIYEVRPRKDKRGFDLISDVLPFGRLSYGEPNGISNAIDRPVPPISVPVSLRHQTECMCFLANAGAAGAISQGTGKAQDYQGPPSDSLQQVSARGSRPQDR